MIGSSLRALVVSLAAAFAVLATVTAGAAGAPAKHDNAFAVHNLVSDQAGVADHTDAHLQNAWGLAASAGSPWWVADNGMNVATLYDATGTPFPAASPLVVGVPNAPTGLVASSDAAFVVGTGATAGPSRFIFSTETGKILGWHGGLPAAILGADRSSVGAIYKGLAIAGDHLYATDFHNNRVDVFDSGFNLVSTPMTFVDPKLPHGFAPFGIQALGGQIYVTYAKQDPAAEDEVAGRGLGFVDAYDTAGNFLGRVASRGRLDAPWGLALAPAGFGKLGGDLLVGNFGDGKINAFAPGNENGNGNDNDNEQHGRRLSARLDHGGDSGSGSGSGHGDQGGNGNEPDHGGPGNNDQGGPGHGDQGGNGMFEPRGTLRGADGRPIAIDGLWALEFGMGGANNGSPTTLFFTAGPNDESNGLFGTIMAS